MLVVLRVKRNSSIFMGEFRLYRRCLDEIENELFVTAPLCIGAGA